MRWEGKPSVIVRKRTSTTPNASWPESDTTSMDVISDTYPEIACSNELFSEGNMSWSSLDSLDFMLRYHLPL